MKSLNRRQSLIRVLGCSVAASPLFVNPTWAQSKSQAVNVAAAKPVLATPVASKLRLLIPANAGGGWDTTGRMIGSSLVACGACSEAIYENKGGRGGILGLQFFHENYATDPNALLVGGTVMVGSVALNKPVIDLTKVKPLARLTSEYVVALVLPNSPLRSAADLSRNLRESTKDVAFFGGSLGGVDHMFAGLLARASGGDAKQLNYSAFASGKDDVMGVLTSGRASVVLSGHSEALGLVQNQRVRALGISSRNSQFGIPSFDDQGLKAESSNWRGLLVPAATTQARMEQLTNAVKAATAHSSWTDAIRSNKLNSSLLTGSNFSSLVENDMLTARVMVHLLGLKA